ncbi:hypothetical protein I4F81_002473 [Pyropia yezoensis]|uniref:Uncharacterized protein n=1 Tax=Pyropia yezoensis TaxID=2788 RepID=A0ACC3BR57_PYRYE|nr:hypothetical protein I4F81_002473 [Neopyropia yezoensis]
MGKSKLSVPDRLLYLPAHAVAVAGFVGTVGTVGTVMVVEVVELVRRAGDVSVAAAMSAAVATALDGSSPTPNAEGTDLKSLFCAITAAVKAMDGKIVRLQGAVDHLTSLVTTNAGQADGLAARMQATARVQASTASTLVEFRERVSEALAVVASGAPTGAVGTDCGESPDGGGDGAAQEVGMAAPVGAVPAGGIVAPVRAVAAGGIAASPVRGGVLASGGMSVAASRAPEAGAARAAGLKPVAAGGAPAMEWALSTDRVLGAGERPAANVPPRPSPLHSDGLWAPAPGGMPSACAGWDAERRCAYPW